MGEKPVQVQSNSENWFLSSYLTTEDLMSQFVEFLDPTLEYLLNVYMVLELQNKILNVKLFKNV